MRQLFRKIAEAYPDIEAQEMLIDACAMHLVMKPETLDVIVREGRVRTYDLGGSASTMEVAEAIGRKILQPG